METTTGVAVAVLILSLIIVTLLGRARALGPLVVSGFVLGVACGSSVFVLVG